MRREARHGAERLRQALARASGTPPEKAGRLDFLFDGTRGGDARPPSAEMRPPAPRLAAGPPLAERPWETPPPRRFRGDPEAFLAAGIALEGGAPSAPRRGVAITLAIPLDVVRALFEACAILACGAIAALARLKR